MATQTARLLTVNYLNVKTLFGAEKTVEWLQEII